VTERCDIAPPPVPDYTEVPTCIADPCPPMTPEGEAALERWTRRAESWMRVTYARCAAPEAAAPPP
jgi:hypothetical protein